MKNCNKCNFYCNDDARYCNNCGYEFIEKVPSIGEYNLVENSANKRYTAYVSPPSTYDEKAAPSVDTQQQRQIYEQYLKTYKRNLLLLTFFFGWLGAHKFYTENPLKGLLYFFTCWTQIPLWVSLLELIRYACLTPEELYESTSR